MTRFTPHHFHDTHSTHRPSSSKKAKSGGGFKYLDKNRISSLPKAAGVYVFKSGKTCLYIGKATNIRERVRNHFREPGFRDRLFIKEVKKIGYLKTNSEIEALILEANLIKKYQPKFNILWRDDKNYFYLGITKEEFPRVFITHQPAKIFVSQKLKRASQKLQTNYVGPFVDGGALKQTLKVLRKVFPYRTCRKIPKRPCLWYELKRCPGPCTIVSGLATHIPNLRGKIKREPQRNIKNLIKILQGKKTQALTNLKREMKKFSQTQEFERAAKLRDQIEALENVFQHAQIFQGLIEIEPRNWPEIEKLLKKILGMRRKIKKIEGYDISNIQGVRATGSMVVFKNGKPNKNEYRKFRVKIAGKPNDIAMLKEVISRRLNHPEWRFPQIMLIDGGRAQLNAALQCLTYDVKHIKVVALAKKRNELFIKQKKGSILLKKLPKEVSNLILHIRDEAHRFAVKYHRKLGSIDLRE